MTRRANASDAKRNGGSDSSDINIRRSDRVFLVGATGSGKTTLATIFLARLPWVVVLDPKHQFQFKGPNIRSPKYGKPLVTSKLSEAVKWDEPAPIIYRPSTTECKTGCPAFWDWIWFRENTIVFVDEVIAVSPAVNMPDGYKRAIQMGRSKNIGVWSCTQRPARIPLNILSESEHFFMFELRNPTDIKRVAEFTDPIVAHDRATGHDFWYYSVRDRNPIKRNGKQLVVKG